MAKVRPYKLVDGGASHILPVDGAPPCDDERSILLPPLERADERFAAVHESVVDAVDGSSTGTQVPKMWVLFEAPTIRRS
jgi:hypothetical protein